jgi:hypothetical protein
MTLPYVQLTSAAAGTETAAHGSHATGRRKPSITAVLTGRLEVQSPAMALPCAGLDFVCDNKPSLL